MGSIPATWMRGGTSKGGLFLASDLPSDPIERDALLLRIMGSPDPRQIDGMGGADLLTSKVAIVSPAGMAGADIDYLFAQVSVLEARVSTGQVCGNMLAAVAPFAIERGLVRAGPMETHMVIRQLNDGSLASATVQTPGGLVHYEGETAIDGVPGQAAPVLLGFGGEVQLPTGSSVNWLAGRCCTLINVGMPVLVMMAADFGLSGQEDRATLEANLALKMDVEAIRCEAGPLMGLGDVSAATIPKVALVAPPAGDGTISVRSLIPHRVHDAIGVLAAVSVAAACLLPDGTARQVARPGSGNQRRIRIEHPSGHLDCDVRLAPDGSIADIFVVRTARKLMEGVVFA